MEIQDRIIEIIDYKTQGNKKRFSFEIGVPQTQMTQVARGRSIGITFVCRILSRYPDISARWLLLGEGTMLNMEAQNDLRTDLLNHVQMVLQLDRFVSVMTGEELSQYISTLNNPSLLILPDAKIQEWEQREILRDKEINKRIEAAIQESNRLCKQKKVRK